MATKINLPPGAGAGAGVVPKSSAPAYVLRSKGRAFQLFCKSKGENAARKSNVSSGKKAIPGGKAGEKAFTKALKLAADFWKDVDRYEKDGEALQEVASSVEFAARFFWRKIIKAVDEGDRTELDKALNTVVQVIEDEMKDPAPPSAAKAKSDELEKKVDGGVTTEGDDGDASAGCGFTS